MLGDITIAKEVYLACGYTDMRKSIDGLAAVVQQQFHLNPFQPALFLFCGKRCDRLKALLWEGDGFVLLYKRLESGRFQWPRTESECRPITWQEFRWLMEGLQIEQKSAIQQVSADSKSAASPCIYWIFQHFCGIIISSKTGEESHK